MSLRERFVSYLAERDRRILNMSRLMAAVGTDVDKFALRHDGRDLTDAIRACRTCLMAEACGDWLSRPSGGVDGISFCPNIARFRTAR